MGLWDYLNRAIDTVTTTVKGIVAPQNTPEVSKVKENIPLVSEETQAQQKNEDTATFHTKSINTIYKQIEELCADYRMNMEDVKKAQLLETIAGCSSEELVQKSDAEINGYIDSLKFVLKWQSWKLPWQDRSFEDIQKIAKKANERCIYLETGRSFLSNTFRSTKTLREAMQDAGFNEINAQNIRAYFHSMLKEAIASGKHDRIEDAYKDALKKFGDLLIDTENPDDKALLTAAIAELEATERNHAVKLSLRSCANDKAARAQVAKGVSTHYEAMTCSKDALGQTTSDNDNIEISQASFQYMTEEDSIVALDAMKARRKEIETKIQNGEELAEEELHYYNMVQCSQYAGAMVGANFNTNYDNPNNVLNKIDIDTEELGIREQVYTTAYNYVESHQDSLPITTQNFTQTVDKATGGNYSKVLANAGSNTRAAENSSNSSKTKSDNSQSKTPSQKDSAPEAQNINKNSATEGTKQVSTASTGNTPDKSKTSAAANNYTVTPKAKTKKDANTDKTRTPAYMSETKEVEAPKSETASIGKEQAIQGGVKSVKQYAKENNISTLDLAIDSLNSTAASQATKKWALSQFEAASNSEQLLNFHKITHGSSALAAARTMDDETRSRITTFRSFYIKQSIENLNENSLV